MSPGPSTLEAEIGGVRFACHDGDVLGRAGTVGAEAARAIKAMSRRHLQVQWREDGWQMVALATASNETQLDGATLIRERPYPLGAGEHSVRIEASQIDLYVGIGAAAPSRGMARLPPALERLRAEMGEDGSLLGLVADNVADLIAIIDEHGQRLWNNAAYFTSLGYRPQEINESYSLAEVHPEDLPDVKRVFEESMRTLVGQRLEYRMRRRDGHWVQFESQARVVTTGGGANKYLVLVARDITERKRVERQERERLQRLTDRAVALSDLTLSRPYQEGDQAACFAAAVRAAVSHLHCDRAGVWLLSAGDGTLRCQDEFDRATQAHGCGATLIQGPGEGFLNLMRNERCVLVEGTLADERLEGLYRYLRPRGVGAFLAARIGLGNEVLGMLTLEHGAADAGWSLEDQGFAASLADTLLLCLHARRQAEAFAALQESQRQIAADLAEAGNYVRALLPARLTGGDVQSDFRLVPCTALGGDGFGYHSLDDDHLAIYLIDTVGHGVSAALLAISVLNILRSGSLPATDFHNPSQVLAGLNRTFQMESQNNMFFTAWYGVYRRSTREIVYTAAAHPPAVLLGADGSPVLLGVDGLMIGAEETAAYPNAHATIPRSARLYVYSDGAFEVLDSTGQPWGFDAFLTCLSQPPPAGTSELDALRETLERVNGRPELPDDFSIMRLTFP